MIAGNDSSSHSLPPGFASAWGVNTPPRRGPKPAYSVGQIVQAAMELADAEGFAALSMAKVAQQLGLTTNALYRYVDSKEDLVLLLAEAGWGLPPNWHGQGQLWREAVSIWVKAFIDRCHEHPWLLDMPVRGAPMTPNVLRWLEFLLSALDGIGLSQQEMLQCVLLLDGYARSTATLMRDLRTSTASAVQSSAITEFLALRLREGGFPMVTAMMEAGQYQDGLSESDILFGLDRILDGIEMWIK